jgi:hypothetical protein
MYRRALQASLVVEWPPSSVRAVSGCQRVLLECTYFVNELIIFFVFFIHIELSSDLQISASFVRLH